MQSIVADLRHGIRLLARAPGFTAVAIATLALGIGANTAIYSTIDAVLLRPLPYGDPERIVMVWEDASHIGFARNTPAPANYVDWKSRNQVFTDMAATQSASANLTADGPPEQVLGEIVAAVDPEQPIAAVRTMDEIIESSVVGRRQQMTLLAAFAGLALLLASIGLYGVLSYGVTRRRREIGVRLALGATRPAVVRLVVRHGLVLTAVGLTIGIAAAWAVTRAMNTMLYGVAATDPTTFAGVLIVLSAVAFGACAVPALRAARLDLMHVLRQE